MRLLVLGTGGMANNHAENFSKIEGVELVAAVDVDPARAALFAEKHAIPHTFSSLDEALAWDQFDAVTNVTPDRAHHPTTMRLTEAGKHQFCEKPLAETYEKAIEMTEATRRRSR
jgi:predicted dehydrogenase